MRYGSVWLIIFNFAPPAVPHGFNTGAVPQ
jgi:hypothetical protein